MKTYRSLKSAAVAAVRIESAYQYHQRRLHNIARRDACKGDICIGWDWPTLRAVRPADYALLCDLIRQAHNAAAWVRWYSVVPAPALEFAAA